MDVRIEPFDDLQQILTVVTHPAVIDGVRDDGPSPTLDGLRQANLLWLAIRLGQELAGCYALVLHSQVMAEIHTCILPQFRGVVAQVAAQRLFDWVFANTSCEKLITLVPKFNRPALLYAIHAGMRRQGLITASFRRDGVLHDQVLLGLSKGERSCQ